MKIKHVILIVLLVGGIFFVSGGNRKGTPSKAIFKVNDYEVSVDEFNEGLSRSPFAAQSDTEAGRRQYLDHLIRQKLVLLDAQKRQLDRDPDFLRAIEQYWEKSLVQMAIDRKTKELASGIKIPEEQIHQIYSQMVKEGVTDKSYDDVYAQIKWQASSQAQSMAVEEWMEDLRKKARIDVDKSLIQGDKQGR